MSRATYLDAIRPEPAARVPGIDRRAQRDARCRAPGHDAARAVQFVDTPAIDAARPVVRARALRHAAHGQGPGAGTGDRRGAREPRRRGAGPAGLRAREGEAAHHHRAQQLCRVRAAARDRGEPARARAGHRPAAHALRRGPRRDRRRFRYHRDGARPFRRSAGQPGGAAPDGRWLVVHRAGRPPAGGRQDHEEAVRAAAARQRAAARAPARGALPGAGARGLEARGGGVGHALSCDPRGGGCHRLLRYLAEPDLPPAGARPAPEDLADAHRPGDLSGGDGLARALSARPGARLVACVDRRAGAAARALWYCSHSLWERERGQAIRSS